MDEEVRVFDAFGDALVGEQRADVVAGKKPAQIFRCDIGVDCHEAPPPNALFAVARGRRGVSRKRVWRGSFMAVYTDVAAEDLSRFLAGYDVGALLSYKGIAEGVENSNFLVHTAKGHFILTL